MHNLAAHLLDMARRPCLSVKDGHPRRGSSVYRAYSLTIALISIFASHASPHGLNR